MYFDVPKDYKIRSNFEGIDFTIYPILQKIEKNLLAADVCMHQEDDTQKSSVQKYDQIAFFEGKVLNGNIYFLYRIHDTDGRKKYVLFLSGKELYIERKEHIDMIEKMFALRNTYKMQLKKLVYDYYHVPTSCQNPIAVFEYKAECFGDILKFIFAGRRR